MNAKLIGKKQVVICQREPCNKLVNFHCAGPSLGNIVLNHPCIDFARYQDVSIFVTRYYDNTQEKFFLTISVFWQA